MAKNHAVYVCKKCGHSEPKWAGRCPDCGAWNTFEEKEEVITNLVSGSNKVIDPSLRKLSEVPDSHAFRVRTGIPELDRVLGGGVVRPSSVLIGGEPGIGKSTIMLQVASALSSTGEVLYISGEESPQQVKERAKRLSVALDEIYIFCDTRLEAMTGAIEHLKPDYVVIDSIQTIYTTTIESFAGNPSQIKACVSELSNSAKRNGTTILFVGHVTKDGAIAGPKTVEHLVDTVLYFDPAEGGMRLLRATKNRFGSVDEIGLFEMNDKGLSGVENPSEYFLSSRDGDEVPSGIAFAPVVEGSRAFVVEIQALVAPAKGAMTKVYSDKIEPQRINRIAAILDRHAGIDFTESDLYVNVAGGIRLSEGSIDLAIAMALVSSKIQMPIGVQTAFIGELSLAGEVRPVRMAEKRIKALKELGFARVFAAGGKGIDTIHVLRTTSIRDAVIKEFKKS